MMLAIAVTGLSLGRVSATLDPGAATLPTPDPTPAFLLLVDPGASAGFATPLPFTVVAGDIVLLESASGGNGPANWGEVVRFEDVDGHGLATLYSLDNWSGFTLDPDKTGNVSYILANSDGPVTGYTPGMTSGLLADSSSANEPVQKDTSSSGAITYNIAQPSLIPEPSTCLAGALLLLPFGLSTLRVLRKTRAA